MNAAVRTVAGLAAALLGFLGSGSSCLWSLQAAAGDELLVMESGPLGGPGEYGLQELAEALRKKGIALRRTARQADAASGRTVVAGIVAESEPVRSLFRSGKPTLPLTPESYAMRHALLGNSSVVALGASDARGLMYGLLELARRAPGSASVRDLLTSLPDESSAPRVRLRGIMAYLPAAGLAHEEYGSPEYWNEYFGMLARNRINRFNLVFGHTDPPYPFLFNVAEYPSMRVPDLPDAGLKRNLEVLRMVSRMARERGIEFVAGIWQHRALPGRKHGVVGLDDDALRRYTRAALQTLLELCPDIQGVQFCLDEESGIRAAQQASLLREGLVAGIKAAGRPVLLELNGWGLLPQTLETAAASGVPLRISAKHWAGFMGMPFLPGRMPPDLSYDDFLRYPRPFEVQHQLWGAGSHGLFPWGSVDWVKRFVDSVTLGAAAGFETWPPPAPQAAGTLNAPVAERYWRWPFQRYWFYCLLFGRLAYDPGTPEDVWLDEFRIRFGTEAQALYDAYESASRIIPWLVSFRSSSRKTRIPPEMQMGGLMDFCLGVRPADTAFFMDWHEYVLHRLGRIRTAKMSPAEAARRLADMAAETERALSRLEGAALNAEARATRTDFSALALLARYHARKLSAAAGLAIFYVTGDEAGLFAAEANTTAALALWERLVRLTERIYPSPANAGSDGGGHWKDQIVFVRHDAARVKEVRRIFERYGLFELGLDFGPDPEPTPFRGAPEYTVSYPVERRFRLLSPSMKYSRQTGFGWASIAGLSASPPRRVPYTSLEGSSLENLDLPSGELYRDYIRGNGAATLLVDVPQGDYVVTAIVANQPEIASGAFRMGTGGGAWVGYAPGETGDKQFPVRASGGRIALDFVPEPGRDWIVSGLVIARRAPHIGHIPLLTAPAGPGPFSVTLSHPEDLSRIVSAKLVRSAGLSKPEQVELRPDMRQYWAQVHWPASWKGRRVRYHIEASDNRGARTRLPAQGEFELTVGSPDRRPQVLHEPPSRLEPGSPAILRFHARSPSGISAVRLHYRHMNQGGIYATTELPGNASGAYAFVIPAGYVTPGHDLMYFVEAFDASGGVILPGPDRSPPYWVVPVIR